MLSAWGMSPGNFCTCGGKVLSKARTLVVTIDACYRYIVNPSSDPGNHAYIRVDFLIG